MPMYLGNDKIIPVVPTDTSDATATAGDILAGKTAYGATGKLTGTIPTKTGETITPGTENQTISGGQYLTGDITVEGDADLVAGNIKSGVSLFGVAGSFTCPTLASMTADATATVWDIAAGKTAYVNGKKITGTEEIVKTKIVTIISTSYIYDLVYDDTYKRNISQNVETKIYLKGNTITIGCGSTNITLSTTSGNVSTSQLSGGCKYIYGITENCSISIT